MEKSLLQLYGNPVIKSMKLCTSPKFNKIKTFLVDIKAEVEMLEAAYGGCWIVQLVYGWLSCMKLN